LNLAPPQKSSKFVDESTTLPLHTSKMLDGLHKLLPLLLHTKKKHNDKKKTNWAFYPEAWATLASFSPEFLKKSRFFQTPKNHDFWF
jgi:hypothetical protein